MTYPTKMNDEELKRARDLAAAVYMSSSVHLLARQLGIDTSDTEGVNNLAMRLVDPVNLAIEASWLGLMEDKVGRDAALEDLRKAVESIAHAE